MALLPALAEAFRRQCRVSILGRTGPNGAPFAGHTKAARDEPVLWRSGRLAPVSAREFGLLLRELRAFPVERASRARAFHTWTERRAEEARASHYEQVIRHMFPLVSCEARTYVEQGFEAYLNEQCHTSISSRHWRPPGPGHELLDRARDGSHYGLIDSGRRSRCESGAGLWLPLYGFERLGSRTNTRLPAKPLASG